MTHAFTEWRRLEELLVIIKDRSIERLAPDEILEFGRLYRQAAAELSYHRTHEADQEQLVYLNDLVGRCYPYVYAAPRRPWPSARRFFCADFPVAFRRHFVWILLAFIISMIPAIIGYIITVNDRAVADEVFSKELLTSSQRVAERHHTAKDWMPLGQRPYMSGFVMQNNLRVTITAFAGGMTAGIVTIIIMITNGLMLGVSAAVVGMDGMATALNFWAFVAPHGVFELTAIFISGGAGLLLAYALLNPGEVPRRIALREAGKEAFKLILGVVSMLVIAGLLEGLFSPMPIKEEIKFTVAGVEAILLFSYFIFAGRRKQQEQGTPHGKLMTPLPPI